MNSIADLPTELMCHKKLHRIIWGDCKCPECGCKLHFTDSYEWCSQCRKKYRIKSQTIFRHSKITFQNIWLLIWCWQNKQSVGTIKFLTGLSYLTIHRWLKKLRAALPEDKTILEGIVEGDESFIGKRRFGNQHCIVGVIERGSRRVRLRQVSDRYRQTIEKFVLDTVRPDSAFYTDSLRSYNELYLYGYKHQTCNHNIGDFGLTNHIENLWSVMKRHLYRMYGYLSFSKEELDGILIEWENRQNSPHLFYNVENYLFSCCSV